MDHPLSFLDFLVGLYDPHGDAHALSVSNYAVALAKAAGLQAGEVGQIELAAHYHDIGKIAIPEGIRRFPGNYTPLEIRTMQEHAQVGAQLLQLLDFDPVVIAIVLNHHENFDGSGYPTRLRRDLIPIGARIIRIVDSFDALTHSRGYRPACSQKKALEKLEENADWYDPRLLDIFSEVITQSWTRQPSH
jgi:putative nucleotidyltransferase with HDIG domain